MSKGRIGIAIAALAVSSVAFAQQGYQQGLQQGYVGLSVGQAQTKFDSGTFNTRTFGSSDDRDTAYKLFVGTDFNKAWGLEAGYADFGKPHYSYTSGGVAGNGEAKATSWFLAGKGMMPIRDQFNLFAKLGITRNKLETSGDSTKTDLLAGIGAEYTFNKRVGLRLEYEDFGKFGDDSNSGRARVNMWSLGVTFKTF